MDEEITTWRNRPLEKEYPYLVVDARYEKIRTGNRVISQGVPIVLGVGRDGLRQILTVDITNTKDKRVLVQGIPRS